MYRSILEYYLTHVSEQDREVYSKYEVSDILLDLWNALDEEPTEAIPA